MRHLGALSRPRTKPLMFLWPATGALEHDQKGKILLTDVTACGQRRVNWNHQPGLYLPHFQNASRTCWRSHHVPSDVVRCREERECQAAMAIARTCPLRLPWPVLQRSRSRQTAKVAPLKRGTEQLTTDEPQRMSLEPHRQPRADAGGRLCGPLLLRRRARHGRAQVPEPSGPRRSRARQYDEPEEIR